MSLAGSASLWNAAKRMALDFNTALDQLRETKMKAAYIKQTGPAESILYGELPKPAPALRKRW